MEETRHEVEGERVIKAKALKILNDMKPEYIRIKEENEALKAEVCFIFRPIFVRWRGRG